MQNKSIVPLPGEVWKDISWTDGIYQVSSCGRVRRTQGWDGHQLCSIHWQRTNKDGYLVTTLKFNGIAKEKLIHQLVSQAFIGPVPHGLVPNHKDANKENNFAENLEYITVGENNIHAIQMGRRTSGRFGMGATRHPRGWRAEVRKDNRRYYLGIFEKREDASIAYLFAKNLLYAQR